MSKHPLPLLLSALLPLVASAAPPARPAAVRPAARPAGATSVAAPVPPDPRVLMQTSMGRIVLELYPQKAPKTVANFLRYVHDGFYPGTVFHRVIKGFLVQGGLYTSTLTAKRTRAPIAIEANNGLSNLRGTVAAARAADPNSATAQFFINLVDNPRLDFVSDQSGATWGYTVFGKVIQGMDVVDKIGDLPTAAQGPFTADVPHPLPLIESVSVLPTDAPLPAATPAAATVKKPPPGKPAARH
ncbi:MAG: peptidylprolyl isomerase [Xanthomonadaceae bacterium]|nr:peptidylprolyl isomerase [Xanthomonadaceae bacterium]MDE2176956.1 peptidylprolyl isomerase [Xanthomonadaceae bacterium]